MVRRRTARGLKLVERIVRVNVSGLSVENRSPGLDDDAHVSVLINPAVTRTRLSVQVFRHAVGLFFRLLLSSADLGRTLSNSRRRGGGKVESVLFSSGMSTLPARSRVPGVDCRLQHPASQKRLAGTRCRRQSTPRFG